MSERRLLSCIEQWPYCSEGEYNPSCCRFPKSCSCTIYSDNTPDELLESDSCAHDEDAVRAYYDRMHAEDDDPLRAELAEAQAEIARLTEERDYAADPFNWEARWTGDEVMGWAITHGNYIQIGEEQGQVFMRMRAVAAVEEGNRT